MERDGLNGVINGESMVQRHFRRYSIDVPGVWNCLGTRLFGMVSPERMEVLQNFEFFPTDIIIIAYPKSGTTWMSEIVSAMAHHSDWDYVNQLTVLERVPWLESNDSDLELSKTVTSYRRAFFTHLPVQLLPKSIINVGCKIIYMCRNPKDVVVSFYHFHLMHKGLLHGKDWPWQDFFDNFLNGLTVYGSWFEHIQEYLTLENDLGYGQMLIVHYENLKKDFFKEAARLAKFLEIRLDEDFLQSLQSHCSFTKMKQNPMTNQQLMSWHDQSVSTFFRKGEIGDWKNHFTVAQNEMFDKVYEKKMAQCNVKFTY